MLRGICFSAENKHVDAVVGFDQVQGWIQTLALWGYHFWQGVKGAGQNPVGPGQSPGRG